jgi:hypothetical protein
MATTQNTYTGNGSTILFSFTFPYLDESDIKVEVNGTLTTAYTLANATTIQFNTAPANGSSVRIYRETDASSNRATFFPGSAVRAQDLNDNFAQALYVSQETANFAASTDASAVLSTASLALSNSQQAVAVATGAESTANGIAATANSALVAANSAVSTVSSALPKSGGIMSGDIIFTSSQNYPKVPQNVQASSYTLVTSDAGKHVSITTGGVTVPAVAFSVGDIISIYNNSGSTQAINQGAGVVLRQAGTANTGNRTLDQYGVATILCVGANTFVISGVGVA